MEKTPFTIETRIAKRMIAAGPCVVAPSRPHKKHMTVMKELNDPSGASLTLHDQHDIRMINYTLTKALTNLNDSPSLCHIS